MAATASIKFVVQSPYRGGNKTWSTRFHVTGGDWQDATHFNTFSDACESEFRSMLPTESTIVETVGYNGGSDLPVFTKAYGVAGTADYSTKPRLPLEVVSLWRFTTDARSSKNHPIYLFNYIHNVHSDSLTAAETLASGAHTTQATRVADWIAGFSDGTLTRKRAGPNGAVAQDGSVSTYVTHRDFPT